MAVPGDSAASILADPGKKQDTLLPNLLFAGVRLPHPFGWMTEKDLEANLLPIQSICAFIVRCWFIEGRIHSDIPKGPSLPEIYLN